MTAKKFSLWLLILFTIALSFPGIISAQTINPQGNETNFAKDMDLATITIDGSKLNRIESLEMYGSSPTSGREPTLNNNKTITYNFSVTRELFAYGGNFRIKFKDAAILSDGTRKDLIFDFSGVRLAFRKSTALDWPYTDTMRIFAITSNGLDFMGRSSEKRHFGLRVDSLNIRVDGVSDGSFIYTLYGLNIFRKGDSFKDLIYATGGSTENNNFSEQAQVLGGALSDVYTPADHNLMRIDGTRFIADKTETGANTSYITGFAVLANAASGLSAMLWQDAPYWTKENESSTDYYLMPDTITHTITSSSADHGSITVGGKPGGSYNGNPYGALYLWEKNNAGSGPLMYDVANGKTVDVVMTPESSDYVIDKLYVNGYEATIPPQQSDGTYNLSYSDNSNRSIHVTWKKVVDVKVKKVWDDDNDASGKRPTSVTINLHRSDTPTTVHKSVTLPQDNKWEYTFEKLDAEDSSGNPYTYTVSESPSPVNSDYRAPVITGAQSSGYTIKNILKKDYDFPVFSKSISGSMPVKDFVDTYTFEITAVDPADAPKPEKTKVTLKSNDSPLEVSFGKMTFTADGTYKYTVKETDSGKANANTTTYTVILNIAGTTVTQTYEKDGSSYSGSLEFVNEYPEVEVQVTKIWKDSGNTSRRPSDISVQLLQNGSVYSTTTLSGTGDSWTHTFHKLPVNDANGKPYTYTVKEATAHQQYYNSVTTGPVVSDNTISYTITNTLKLEGTIPTIGKIIEGPTPNPAETYTFVLAALTSGAPMPTSSTVTIRSDASPKTADFGSVEFPKDGTYSYQVTERKGSAAGAEYDNSKYVITFEVENNTVTSSVTKDGTVYSDSYLVFDNRYPWPDGWAAPTVRKIISGTKPETEETYTFRLHPKTSGAPMPENVSSDGNSYVTVTGERTASFGPVHFLAGTYEYGIREVPGESSGVVYDSSEYHVTITVGTDGKISKQVLKDGSPVSIAGDVFEFTNQYPTEFPEVDLKVQKVVRDGTPDIGDRFYFELKATGKPDGVTDYPMPVLSDGSTKIININYDDIISRNYVAFGIIELPALGKYTYEVTEIIPEDTGRYEYDATKFTVEWDVKIDEKTGKAVAEQHVYEGESPVHVDALVFKNQYVPDEAGDSLRVEKVIKGWETETDENFQFTLTLKDYPAGIEKLPMPDEYENDTLECTCTSPNGDVVTCVIKGGSLEFLFGWMSFPADGKYVYEVAETNTGSPEYKYDGSVYTVTYIVKNGEISSKKITKDGAAYSSDTIVFTNTNLKRPESDYAHVTPEIVKSIVGEKPGADDTFKFVLERKGNTAGIVKNPMPEGSSGDTKTIEIGHQDGEGSGDFGEITFMAVGVYTYEIREVSGDLSRYEYDDTVYTLYYTVTEASEADPLEAELRVEVEGFHKEDGEISFENVKLPEPPAANPEVRKFVSGEPKMDEFFRFTLKGISKPEGVEEMPMPFDAEDGVKTIEIKGTDHGHFGGFHFPADGDYVYEVWEEEGTTTDYSYDKSVYTVTYTVKDKDVVQVIRKDGAVHEDHAFDFENLYLKGISILHLPVRKVIKGSPNRTDTFKFQIKSRSNDAGLPVNPLPTGAENGIAEIEIEGHGEHHFGGITFTRPGRYIYQVKEVAGNDPDFRYDGTVYTLTVDVSENKTGDGMVIKTTIEKGAEKIDGDTFVFTNVFGDGGDEDSGGEGGDGGGSVLPKTGFAPGRVTNIGPQRVAYAEFSHLRLQIPGLGVDSEIFGVPYQGGDWDVSWLGDNVGWLQNSAFPGSLGAGNTVITGHSTNYLGQPGVFDKIGWLGYGAPIIIQAYGETFTYSVESVDVVYADTPGVLSQKTDAPMLTLITCKFFNEATNQYDGRVVVKAKLTEVK